MIINSLKLQVMQDVSLRLTLILHLPTFAQYRMTHIDMISKTIQAY